MEYILTKHAKERLKERKIPQKLIKETLKNPTKVSRDPKNKNRVLFKKIYQDNNFKRLLLIIGEVEKGKLKIIIIIDTSKIKKYL